MPHFIFIQQISVLNILNMLYNLHFFYSKCRLFHNAALFGFCITHILNTGCAKIWKKKSVAKRLMVCEMKDETQAWLSHYAIVVCILCTERIQSWTWTPTLIPFLRLSASFSFPLHFLEPHKHGTETSVRLTRRKWSLHSDNPLAALW